MLVILVGPNGSGKSHVGSVLQSALGIFFFEADLLFAEHYGSNGTPGNSSAAAADGLKAARAMLVRILHRYPQVCAATTGTSPGLLADLLAAGEAFGVRLVNVRCPLDVCMRRLAERADSNAGSASLSTLKGSYHASASLDLAFHLVLDNTALTNREIVTSVGRLFHQSSGGLFHAP